jgi:hypothetical protein
MGGTKRLKGSLLFARSSRSPFCQFGIPFVGVVVVVVVVQLILISYFFSFFRPDEAMLTSSRNCRRRSRPPFAAFLLHLSLGKRDIPAARLLHVQEALGACRMEVFLPCWWWLSSMLFQ